jgi:DNA-directed RNA polymerase specialized sigma24 family protein
MTGAAKRSRPPATRRRHGAGRRPVCRSWPGGPPEEIVGHILDLDAALEKLGRDHQRAARVFELRAFSGLTIAETAAVLGVCTATVEDAWALARAWLWRELHPR